MSFSRIIGVFCVMGVFGYGLVYSNNVKQDQIRYAGLLSKNIYVDAGENLSHTIVKYRSPIDISSYRIGGGCEVESRFLQKQEDLYFFEIGNLKKDCFNPVFYLITDDKTYLKTRFTLLIQSQFDLYNRFTDVTDVGLQNYSEKLQKVIDGNLVSEVNGDLVSLGARQKRLQQEALYVQDVVVNIQAKREFKYLIPVEGYKLPEKNTKLPNSPRPYRAGYTDGVHNGWDIDAPKGTPVRAIDDAVVVKVISDFKFKDLDAINMSGSLSYEEKIKNLDILRGNQVWLKTMKGDVMFYAHLDSVADIKEGDMVERGQYLGTVGSSGVPDLNYTDFHLHFELKKNPYGIKFIGKNTLMDYMKWDWYFKNQTKDYIIQHQYDIFE